MRKDSRLSRVLHVLVHLDAFKAPVTSDTMAEMLSTNPVVVRRTMALLRDKGYVESVKGHSGGWSLSKPLNEITLLDVHNALGSSSVFTIGLTDEYTSCPIEKAVNAALGDVMTEAEALMLERFGEITLDVLGGLDR
ncbi:Rrf2 family transcriptional regulator [Pseudohongiella nitratireducens]|uniref:Rrf2 family transcriptional regulator n=1 Tax=Pseudohongiella nitratireducens TaxID=1768907 RepID=UPI0030EC6877|tara:strand:- start:2297 stop:2707 length:411 start_codon:yes stop_codon:yes gene_type:complete